MPSILIDGVNIKYEEMGSGEPVVLTPGGRSGMEPSEDCRAARDRLPGHHIRPSQLRRFRRAH